ncbi:MAG: DDE-type integrase/transposase/recombinase [Deltaproteobacteria bacterium]
MVSAKKKPRAKGATRGTYRQYTDEQREAIARDAAALGVAEAARKHGTSESNVSRWGAEFEARKPVKQVTQSRPRGSRDATTAAPAKRATVARQKPPARKSAAPRTRNDTAPATPSSLSKSKITRVASQPKVSAPAVPAPIPTTIASAPPPSPTKRPGKIAKSYTPSQRASILELAAADGVSNASVSSGVSRFSIYDWRRKLTASVAGLGPSPTSGPCVADIEELRDREILDEWKRHPGLGPSQIRNQLRRKGIKVAVNTTRIVMESAGYRPPKVRRHPHDQRFEAVRPNHLWHLDFLHRHIHRANTWTLIVIDDHSRFVVGHGVDDAERADMVIETFERAVQRYGRPERVMHDRGSAFWSWKGISRFTALLTELGCDQVVAEQKETNGKIEVFNSNIAKELFDVHRFADVAEMRRRLETHLHWYNHGRTHHALGGLLVPADRHYGRVDEVLARIEAGAGRDLGDGIDLRTRSLDLFKVVSRDGASEVWLMGKKILDLHP